ncbi:MAG TPA: peptidoglycan editing factor PgeF [Cytophagaceae bacterium]|jgi:YfiH family protein|nr:peptidoglycan editing factor PgeF [Cytophagaceae bacterium]
MIETLQKDLPLWQFENMSLQKGIIHFVSGRKGGFSKEELGELNLSFKVGDDPVWVLKNRNKLAEAFNISSENLIFPVQTHSNHVTIIEKEVDSNALENTDALITSQRGILISVMSADCVPVLLYDPVKKVVAAIHAGWRGTMAEIVKISVEKMQTEFGSVPKDIIASIGPSISEEVYEVGEEVIDAVLKVYGSKAGIISREQNGKGHCNLWEANRIQLIQSGVLLKNIEIAGVCTYRNADVFFSARKSGNKAGRFAAGIMLL